jgi:hypothetical protein
VLIEGDENAFVTDGEAEEKRVGDLAIAVETGSERGDEVEPASIDRTLSAVGKSNGFVLRRTKPDSVMGQRRN